MYSKVNQSNKYIVPEKECRITKYKQNGYEFIYFYKSKEEAEKYLNDNNEWNDKTYALNVIEDQKGTTQKIDAMLSSNLKTCPNVFDEDDDEDFILELLRKIKLANKFGEYLTLPFGSAEKDASEITLPNGSIITDVEVVVNKNSVSLKDVKAEHEWEIGFSDSVFCFGVSDETEQYPLQISCNATDATALRKYLGLKVSVINSMPVQPIDHYIVSVDDATIRKSEDRTKFENKNIPMGTEVVIVSEETVKGKVVAYVKLVDSDPELFYYTTKSNLTKIEVLEKPEDWRLLKDIESVKLPFSSILTKQIHVVGDYEIVAKCGNFLCISNGFFDNLGLNEGYLGYWVDCSNMIKIVELPKTIEERKIKIEKSVVDVTNRINTKTKKAEGVGPQACNMCTRTALYYLTGDPVLFPRTGSRIHFTFDKTTDPEIKGNVSGYGKAADIISDLRAGILDDYFEEIEKKSEESFLSYWERLQNYADEGEIIIGAYGTNHVFMIVPGGMIPVVDNSSHTQGGLLKESYKTNPSISDGDKYGFSFNARKILFVNRILECGTTVKDANAPVYANMDYRGYTGETKKINFYKYKKK